MKSVEGIIMITVFRILLLFTVPIALAQQPSSHAHDYMKEKKYTFPVIADWALITKLFKIGEGHFPEWWLVNPEGRLSYPIRQWSFGRFLFEVERTAAPN
jgi:hypothetical protein